MHTLNKSTTYNKISKYPKNLLYVKELTSYEVMNVKYIRILKNQIQSSKCIFKIYQYPIYHQVQNHVRNKMVQTILQYDQRWPNLCGVTGKRKVFCFFEPF